MLKGKVNRVWCNILQGALLNLDELSLLNRSKYSRFFSLRAHTLSCFLIRFPASSSLKSGINHQLLGYSNVSRIEMSEVSYTCLVLCHILLCTFRDGLLAIFTTRGQWSLSSGLLLNCSKGPCTERHSSNPGHLVTAKPDADQIKGPFSALYKWLRCCRKK